MNGNGNEEKRKLQTERLKDLELKNVPADAHPIHAPMRKCNQHADNRVPTRPENVVQHDAQNQKKKAPMSRPNQTKTANQKQADEEQAKTPRTLGYYQRKPFRPSPSPTPVYPPQRQQSYLLFPLA